MIDSEEVELCFLDCLYKKEEVPKDGSIPEGCIQVEGLVGNFGFHPQRLESKRQQVKAWLAQLPREFFKGTGEGTSFSRVCYLHSGGQWTGFHRSAEQLITLGIGLGFVKSVLPRERWHLLPGGLPYYMIDLSI